MIRQLAGYAATLPCTANGVPAPTIEWSKNNISIFNTSRFQILPSGSLLIHDVSDSDSGFYRCGASNKGGSDFRDIFLDVQCR